VRVEVFHSGDWL